MHYKYPLAKPDLTGDELKNLTDCIKNSWISQGQYVALSEEKMKYKTFQAYALATSSGTAALHLAMRALGIGPGDEVIVPALCFVAVANAVLYCGARPKFCDITEDYGLDLSSLEQTMTERTKAVVAAHLYGVPCEIALIKEFCKERMVYLIEDAAEDIGATVKTAEGDMPVGSFGDISVFSFFGNKTVTCGEGGMAVTNNKTFHERMKLLRDHGLSKRMDRYEHSIMGHNYRMTDLQGAVLSAQLDRVDEFVIKKRRINEWYRYYLKGLHLIVFPEWPRGSIPSWWLTTIGFRGPADSLALVLKSAGIETKRFFTPLMDLPYLGFDGLSECSMASDVSAMGLCLPSHTGLNEDDVSEMCKIIEEHHG